MTDPALLLTPAPLSSDTGLHFGDPAAEAESAAHESCAAPLGHLGLLSVTGADAESFLQSQLSNDVRALASGGAQLSSYNSAKGRMLAVLRLWRSDAGFALELEREILPAILKRLRMYVLRARVQLAEGARAGLGLAGADAAAALAELGLPAPDAAQGLVQTGDAAVLRLPGAMPRFALHADVVHVQAFWTVLSQRLRPVGTNAWRRLDIDAGLPTVLAATQEHFVPQMAGLDRLGGISFTKGCYPGQEIVARLHYLGEAKRALYRLEGEGALAPGAELQDAQGAAVGEAVIAAALPSGRSRALAVLQKSAADAELRLGDGRWRAAPAYAQLE